MSAKELDLSLDHKIADLSLADFGKKEMQLSEREMPGLMELIKRYGDEKPLKGFKDSDAVLDCAFKELKLDGLFSDFAGNVVEYLKKNGLR